MRDRTRELSLFFPWLPQSDESAFLTGLSAVELRQWARADSSSGEQGLLQAFGCATPEAPVAAIQALGLLGAEQAKGYWLQVSPVHLYADRDHLVLFDSSSFPFLTEESKALLECLQAEYAQDGWAFHWLSASEWIVRAPSALDLQLPDLDQARGRSVRESMPKGGDAPHLNRMLNEIQMLFHRHPVQAAREERGEVPVNGVWFSRPGSISGSIQSPFRRLYADDTLARGLARWSGTKLEETPESVSDCLNDTVGDAIAVVLDLSIPHSERMRRFLRPALGAIDQRTINRLHVHPGNGRRYTFTSRQKYRFWRRGTI